MDKITSLKEKRLKAGLSQSQLAQKSEVPLTVIQKYESQARDINKAQVITIWKLSKVLNSSIEGICELENNK